MKTYLDYTQELYRRIKANHGSRNCFEYLVQDEGWTMEECLELRNHYDAGTEMTLETRSRSKWPKINGVMTYPFTQLLTDEQNALFKMANNDYKKNGPTGTGVPRVRTVTVTKSPEVLAAEQKLREKLEELGDQECLEAFNLLHPTQEMLERRAKLAQLEELRKRQEELAKELGL